MPYEKIKKCLATAAFRLTIFQIWKKFIPMKNTKTQRM